MRRYSDPAVSSVLLAINCLCTGLPVVCRCLSGFLIGPRHSVLFVQSIIAGGGGARQAPEVKGRSVSRDRHCPVASDILFGSCAKGNRVQSPRCRIRNVRTSTPYVHTDRNRAGDSCMVCIGLCAYPRRGKYLDRHPAHIPQTPPSTGAQSWGPGLETVAKPAPVGVLRQRATNRLVELDHLRNTRSWLGECCPERLGRERSPRSAIQLGVISVTAACLATNCNESRFTTQARPVERPALRCVGAFEKTRPTK